MTVHTYDSAEVYWNGERIPAYDVSIDMGSGDETGIVVGTFGEPGIFTCEVEIHDDGAFWQALEEMAVARFSQTLSERMSGGMRRHLRGKRWRATRKAIKRALGWHGRWTAEGRARENAWAWDWWPDFLASQRGSK